MMLISCQKSYSWIGKACQHTGQGFSLLAEGFGDILLCGIGEALYKGQVGVLVKWRLAGEQQSAAKLRYDTKKSIKLAHGSTIIGLLLLGDTTYKAYTWYLRDRIFPGKPTRVENKIKEQLEQQKI